MTISFSDFPTLMILFFISLVVAVPVKLSASLVGSKHAGMVRSFFAMIVPVIIVIAFSETFPIIMLLYPLILIFSIRFILGTGFIGAVGIAAVSAAIYYIVITKFMSGIAVSVP